MHKPKCVLMKARNHLEVGNVCALAKVVGQVSDAGWSQLVVLTKPIAKPTSGAVKAAKLCASEVRAFGANSHVYSWGI